MYVNYINHFCFSLFLSLSVHFILVFPEQARQQARHRGTERLLPASPATSVGSSVVETVMMYDSTASQSAGTEQQIIVDSVADVTEHLVVQDATNETEPVIEFIINHRDDDGEVKRLALVDAEGNTVLTSGSTSEELTGSMKVENGGSTQVEVTEEQAFVNPDEGTSVVVGAFSEGEGGSVEEGNVTLPFKHLTQLLGGKHYNCDVCSESFSIRPNSTYNMIHTGQSHILVISLNDHSHQEQTDSWFCVQRCSLLTPPSNWSMQDRATLQSAVWNRPSETGRFLILFTDVLCWLQFCAYRHTGRVAFWSWGWMTSLQEQTDYWSNVSLTCSEMFSADLTDAYMIHTNQKTAFWSSRSVSWDAQWCTPVTFWSLVWVTAGIGNSLVPDLRVRCVQKCSLLISAWSRLNSQWWSSAWRSVLECVQRWAVLIWVSIVHKG